MTVTELTELLADCPVIAAVREDRLPEALASDARVIFLLGGHILTVEKAVAAAHKAEKFILIHLDLTEGVGKDKAGVRFLASVGADGIISTRAHLIKAAKECGLLAVQRFFVLDSQGLGSIDEMLATAAPDVMEIMPGVIGKAIARFAKGRTPLIAGGLIETKQEATAALSLGAAAVSTGCAALWNG